MSNQIRKIARANRMRPYPRQTAPVTLTRAQVEMCMPDLLPIQPDGLLCTPPEATEDFYSYSSARRRKPTPATMALVALHLAKNDRL